MFGEVPTKHHIRIAHFTPFGVLGFAVGHGDLWFAPQATKRRCSAAKRNKDKDTLTLKKELSI